MSFITDALFGESPEAIAPERLVGLFGPSQEQVYGNIPQGGFGTGFSNLDPRTGNISLDPTGRNLNLGGLERFSQNLGQTRGSLLGNQGAFQQARVNPLLERLAAGRGQLQRNIGQTGVRGTFGNQALQNFDIAGSRAEGDARSLATQESLNAITALDQLLFNGTTGVGQNISGEELKALGLSAATLNNLLAIAANLATGSGSSAVSSQNNVNTNEIARGEGVRGFVGNLLSGF